MSWIVRTGRAIAGLSANAQNGETLNSSKNKLIFKLGSGIAIAMSS